MKTFLSVSAVLLLSSQAYSLITIDSDTSWPVGYSMTDSVHITNNAVVSVDGAGGAVDTNNYGIKVDAGSKLILNNTNGIDFRFKSSSATVKNVFDFYGTLEKAGGGSVSLILADASDNNVEFNFYSGSSYTSSNGSMNMEVRRGTATVNIYQGATLSGANDLNVGGRDNGNVNGTLNVQGSATFGAWIRLGNTGLASGYNGKAALNVTKGGFLKTRDLGTNIGTGYEASIFMKDLGSKIEVTNGVTLNAINDARSTSVFTVFTGSNFKILNSNALTSNSGSKVVFGLDSNIRAAESTALFSISRLVVNTANAEKTFSFDTSGLGHVDGLSAGDTVNVILFENLTSITVNGVEYILSAMSDAELQAALSDFIDFNFAGNSSWEAFDVTDITKSGNNVVLEMTFVPEPAVFAVIFGTLALALAAYKRRK